MRSFLVEDVMTIARVASCFLLALTSALAAPAFGQASAPAATQGLKIEPMPAPNAGDWHKANSTHRQATFPQTTDDGRYWFQFRAPNAKSVQLEVGGRRYDYEKGGDGTWNLFIANPGPGVKIVTVYVDGVAMPEPGTDVFYSNGWKAQLESPAPDGEFYAVKDVPHGEVREHWFKSSVTGTARREFVYTPPGYDKETAARYPVLYLQHGNGEMEQEWTHSGLANFIVDNLIAEKKAVPMIIVMNNGFASRPGEAAAGAAGVRGAGVGRGIPGTVPAGRGNAAQVTAFEEMLIKDVIPDVDKNFRTVADRDHRALAGLSMGGGQAYTIGFRNLDTFANLGIFSGAIGNVATLPEAMNDPAAFNRRVPVLFVSAGTVGSDLQFHTSGKALVDKATAAGIHATFFESPNTQHEWLTWRRSLHAFAPMLFKP
jgi:enterochelin esterase-like enzyme